MIDNNDDDFLFFDKRGALLHLPFAQKRRGNCSGQGYRRGVHYRQIDGIGETYGFFEGGLIVAPHSIGFEDRVQD